MAVLIEFSIDLREFTPLPPHFGSFVFQFIAQREYVRYAGVDFAVPILNIVILVTSVLTSGKSWSWRCALIKHHAIETYVGAEV